MFVKKCTFGQLSDGTTVEKYTLRNRHITASILTLGGIVQTLAVDGKEVVGGFDTLEDYLTDTSFQGSLIGRVGNRIGNAVFTIGGKTYELAKNDHGLNHLHGGNVGFNRRVWNVEKVCCNRLTLSYTSPDGEENYPGTMTVEVTYSLCDFGIKIDYSAICDKDCPVNLTNHSYFNLDGMDSGDVLDTVATIHADTVTAVDEHLIPTGEHPTVEGTPFDFKTPHKIGERLDETFTGYDHNFVFADAEKEKIGRDCLPHVATFTTKTMEMNVYTDAPGAQFYTANFLGGAPDFKGGVTRLPRHAFCFETQIEPDSINHGGKPLEAGKTFHTVTVYQFRVL